LNVAAVLSQVDDQAVGARQINQHGGGQRIGLPPASGLPERRHMIDVDAEPGHSPSLMNGEQRAMSWLLFAV